MKAELTIPHELVDLIADKVFERLKPLLAGNGRKETEDVYFDKQGLITYLKEKYHLSISKKWIYERTQFKEIPFLKIHGQLRFKKADIDRWVETHRIPATTTAERVFRAKKIRGRPADNKSNIHALRG